MSESTFMGVPRKKIDWGPRIDYAQCTECMECFKFCPHQVFEVRDNESPKVIVKNPNNCVVFCRACVRTCGATAISFPEKKETIQHIQKIREEPAG